MTRPTVLFLDPHWTSNAYAPRCACGLRDTPEDDRASCGMRDVAFKKRNEMKLFLHTFNSAHGYRKGASILKEREIDYPSKGSARLTDWECHKLMVYSVSLTAPCVGGCGPLRPVVEVWVAIVCLWWRGGGNGRRVITKSVPTQLF
jgi:hypothetical protein